MMADLDVGFGIRIPARALGIAYSRSGGPGGQNVNKVETKATVRLDLLHTTVLPEWARAQLLTVLATRLTKHGELIVTSERHRERAQNLAAACTRLAELLHTALTPKTPRKETRPTRGSKVRRLESKKRRGGAKRARGSADLDEDGERF